MSADPFHVARAEYLKTCDAIIDAYATLLDDLRCSVCIAETLCQVVCHYPETADAMESGSRLAMLRRAADAQPEAPPPGDASGG